MTKEKIKPSEEGDYTLNNPFKPTNDKSAWESLAFFPITGLFSAALPFIINKKTGSDSGISTGKKNIKDVLKDIADEEKGKSASFRPHLKIKEIADILEN